MPTAEHPARSGKDADRNTYEPHRMEPLPFRAMKRYGDPIPNTPELK